MRRRWYIAAGLAGTGVLAWSWRIQRDRGDDMGKKKHKHASMAGMHVVPPKDNLSAPAQRLVVLGAYEDHPNGLTDREATAYVTSFLDTDKPESYRRRCSDLRASGDIARTDARSDGGYVSVITEQGRALLRAERNA